MPDYNPGLLTDRGNDTLNGGDYDGIADYLNGRSGADPYHFESYWNYWTQSYQNLENSFGFNSSEGDIWV